METILDCVHTGIIAVNKEGVIVLCNKAAYKMMEIHADAVGRPIATLVPETKMLEVIETGQGHYGQKFSYHSKNFLVNRTPVLENGEVIGAVVVFQDATELEEISTELASYKKINWELETILESSYDGIIITEGNGNVTKINQSLLRVTGLGAEYFIGKNTDDLFGQGVFAFESVAQRARTGKKILTDLQKIHTGKEVMVTSTPIMDEDQNVIKVVTNVRDMSDIVALQKQLARSHELSNQLRLEFNKLLAEDLQSHELISRNPKMYEILEMTKRVAGSDANVLLQGESGVGKEVFAKLIHVWSKRKGAFIKINSGALPAHLLESELFGYAKGAFTGAKAEGKQGFFDLADHGTLFLDEIEDLPLELQGKFLRVLQDKEFTRVGGTKVIKVDVRLITASNMDLRLLVDERKFRKDLFYRLNVVPVLIPPLRERREDIPLLIEHFLRKFNEKYDTHKEVTPQLLEKFLTYDWSGNVRELQNVMERLILTIPEKIISTVPFWGNTEQPERPLPAKKDESDSADIPPLKKVLEETERQLLEKALLIYKNSRQIGSALGISHTAVLKKLKRYGIRI